LGVGVRAAAVAGGFGGFCENEYRLARTKKEKKCQHHATRIRMTNAGRESSKPEKSIV